MALDTYDNLVKEVIDWSGRNDIDLKVPDFIRLAEEFFYKNPIEPLRVFSQETVTASTTTGQYIDLPTNYQQFRSVRLLTGDSGGELRFQAPEQMQKIVSTGRPQFFTVIANQIQFERVPDSEYDIEFQFWARPEALTDANQTNDILTNNPQLYLQGALYFLFLYAKDTENMSIHKAELMEAIAGANEAADSGRYGPAPTSSLDGGMCP